MFKSVIIIAGTIIAAHVVTAKSIDTVTVGTIKVVVRERALLVPVAPAIDSGILEYLAVTKGGKTYESVLAADCDAKDLHAALLLINARQGGVAQKNDSLHTPVVTGDSMRLEIVYPDAKGKLIIRPASDLIRHCNRTKRSDGDAAKKKFVWVFVGSQDVDIDGQGKKTLASALEGSLISIKIDPTAEISLSEQTDNPYRGELQGFCIDEKVVAALPKSFYLRIVKKS